MSALVCGKRSQSTLFEDEFLSPLPSSKRIPCSAALHFSPPTSAVSSPQPPPIDHLRSFFPDMDQEFQFTQKQGISWKQEKVSWLRFYKGTFSNWPLWVNRYEYDQIRAPVGKFTSLESILVNITMAYVGKYTSLESILVNITMAMFMVHILQGEEAPEYLVENIDGYQTTTDVDDKIYVIVGSK